MDDGRIAVETTEGGDFGDLVKVRKFVMHVEEILHEFGPPAECPQLKGYIAAVTHNPYAGQYVEDILPLMEQLKPMGMEMSKKLMAWHEPACILEAKSARATPALLRRASRSSSAVRSPRMISSLRSISILIAQDQLCSSGTC